MLIMDVVAARKKQATVGVFLIAFLSGCTPQNVKNAPVTAQPKSAPVKNFTSFSNAIACMDTLMLEHGVPKIRLTSSGIPDSTGAVQAGTRDMMITALSRMSAKSGSLAYVDYDLNQSDVMTLQDLAGQQFETPDYYIRGAITQLDSGVSDSHAGGGIALPFADFGLDKNQVVSMVSLDLNLGNFATREIMAGYSANNSMAVVREGTSGDAGGRIKKAGLFINVGINQSEGMHQSVRTLLELSLIELVGKLTHVPYWECLNIESTNPMFMTQAQEWFDRMPQPQRVSYVASTLAAMDLYNGPIEAQQSSELTAAISHWQADQGLTANGRISFELYYSLLNSNHARRPIPQQVPLTTTPIQPVQEVEAPAPVPPVPQVEASQPEVNAQSHSESAIDQQVPAPPTRPSGIRKLAKDEW